MRQIGFISAFITLGALLTGCHSAETLQEVCTGQLAQFEQELETAARELGPLPEKQGRAIASHRSRDLIDEEDQERWERWSRKKLKESQVLIDLASADPALKEAHDEMNVASQNVVRFHSYAGYGQVNLMRETLAEVRERVARAREIACATTP